MRPITLLLLMALTMSPVAVSAETPKETIRLYAPDMSGKRYLTGHDWMQLDIQEKLGLIEEARRGALKMNAVMTMPAEVYIANLDRMFSENANVRHIDLGQAIQGIAISIKDWHDGSDPDERIKEALGSSAQTS